MISLAYVKLPDFNSLGLLQIILSRDDTVDLRHIVIKHKLLVLVVKLGSNPWRNLLEVVLNDQVIIAKYELPINFLLRILSSQVVRLARDCVESQVLGQVEHEAGLVTTSIFESAPVIGCIGSNDLEFILFVHDLPCLFLLVTWYLHLH